MLQLDQVAVMDLGQGKATIDAGAGSVGQEHGDMGPFGDEGVGLVLGDAGDEDEAGDDEIRDLTLGAVGIDVEFLLAGYVAGAALFLEMLRDVIAAGGGVLLVVEDGHEPFVADFRIEGGVVAVGYGRATRFVHLTWHNRCRMGLIRTLLSHCLCAV